MVQSHYTIVEQMNTFIHSIGSGCGFQDMWIACGIPTRACISLQIKLYKGLI